MRRRIVVVTGVDEAVMDGAMLSLTVAMPGTVAVRHWIDPEAQTLRRVVSDASGILEHERLDLAHACVSCAVREDILPTLMRVAQGDWDRIVCCLPVGADAGQLSTVLSRDPRWARHSRLSAVVAAIGDHGADLLSPDLLRDRGRHSGPDDARGVAEVACAQVELADVVVVDGRATPQCVELVRLLARPGADVVVGPAHLDGAQLTDGRHEHARAVAWRLPTAYEPVISVTCTHAWRLTLTSERPFHPLRLVDHIDALGGGPHRSRGSFWLPTRPADLLEWCGAAGQLSIGTHSGWAPHRPAVHLVLTGSGTMPEGLEEAFEQLLVQPSEVRREGLSWRVREDGLEPWLGEIHDAA